MEQLNIHYRDVVMACIEMENGMREQITLIKRYGVGDVRIHPVNDSFRLKFSVTREIPSRS